MNVKPITLRPYQIEPLRAIVESIRHRRGLTFTVMFSRQAGKNELSAQLEVLLLTLNIAAGGSLVKASPTFKPQTLNSLARLQRRLDEWGFAGFWTSAHGYIVRLGQAEAIFLSAGEQANVVGHTASLLLEGDEAQDILPAKWNKEFRPMASSTNATTVLYGTAWDDTTLLERTKQVNLELEQRDGIRRHFEYDWQAVAACNPAYGEFVAAERDRLGADHPLFTTQYELRTLRAGGRFLNQTQLSQLRGDHLRQTFGDPNKIYVAGLDLAGEAEDDERTAIQTGRARRDSTVLLIGELDLSVADEVNPVGCCRIVSVFASIGTPHAELYSQLLDLLGQVWRVRRVCVDATGVGGTIASLLRERLGESRVEAVRFTTASKSELGYGLLAAINTGRLKMYAGADDEANEFWHQARAAQSTAKPGQILSFSVPASEGHDDYLIAAALLARAAGAYRDRAARGRRAIERQHR